MQVPFRQPVASATGTSVAGSISDDALRERVFDALESSFLIPADAEIDVDVHDGIVQLSGSVPNKRIKHIVGEHVWWIPEVTDVKNDLEVSRHRRGRMTKSVEAEQNTEMLQPK
jgi:osmotically-inducible protein OsmY